VRKEREKKLEQWNFVRCRLRGQSINMVNGGVRRERERERERERGRRRQIREENVHSFLLFCRLVTLSFILFGLLIRREGEREKENRKSSRLYRGRLL
jgi:hypothetical protein